MLNDYFVCINFKSAIIILFYVDLRLVDSPDITAVKGKYPTVCSDAKGI